MSSRRLQSRLAEFDDLPYKFLGVKMPWAELCDGHYGVYLGFWRARRRLERECRGIFALVVDTTIAGCSRGLQRGGALMVIETH